MPNASENTDLLQQLMDNIADNIFFKDRDSKFIMINKANAQWFGLQDPSEAIGKDDSDFFESEHALKQREEEQMIMQTGESVLCEEQSDGRGKLGGWGSVTKIPLRDKNQKVIGIMGIGRDISELKNHELALKKANEKVAQDLQMAAELQQTFLPQDYPSFHNSAGQSLIEFHHFYEADVELGGDFCSVYKLSDTKAGLLICDVMGHGVRAALVTGIIHAIAKELVRTERTPGDFLTALNKRLAPIIQKGEDCLFATAAYFSIDVSSLQLIGATAGHPPPFRIQPQKGTVTELSELNSVRGPALAIIDDYTYQSVEVQFQEGEELLMYTDGVCEAMNSSKDEFGVPHLQQTIQDYNTLPLNELFSSVIKVVKKYTGSNKLGDDACLLGFRLNKPNS